MSRLYRWCSWGMGLSLLGLLTACGLSSRSLMPAILNSRYNDQQPALSGDGRWLAFISDRNGRSELLLYDLQEKQFVPLPGLNQNDTLLQNPSLSRTGRYLAYLSSQQGKPELTLYDRATKRAELLAPGYRNWVRNPQISPDGRYLAFETARRGQWDIEVLDRGPTIEPDVTEGSPVAVP
jgi:Tol biopolymer transport system component